MRSVLVSVDAQLLIDELSSGCRCGEPPSREGFDRWFRLIQPARVAVAKAEAESTSDMGGRFDG